MDLPDVTIVHLAPEEFNYTMSVFRRIFHYESTLLQTQVPWRQVGPLDYLQSLRPQIDQFLTFHGEFNPKVVENSNLAIPVYQ